MGYRCPIPHIGLRHPTSRVSEMLPANAGMSHCHWFSFLRIVIGAPTTDCCRIESTLRCFISRGRGVNGYIVIDPPMTPCMIARR